MKRGTDRSKSTAIATALPWQRILKPSFARRLPDPVTRRRSGGYNNRMVRISDLNPNDPSKIKPGQAASGASKASGLNPAFARHYETTFGTQEKHDLQGLVTLVDRQAEMLVKHPTPAQVASYRDAIRRYMKEIKEKLGRMDKRTDRRNRTLIILRDLDEKVEALTEAILKGQANAIDLAASVNEIRGLLLDLLI